MLDTYVGAEIGDTMSNEVFISFVTGLTQFVLKIVYTVLYFTIFNLLYKWLTSIIRMVFFSGKRKVKKEKKTDLPAKTGEKISRHRSHAGKNDKNDDRRY